MKRVHLRRPFWDAPPLASKGATRPWRPVGTAHARMPLRDLESPRARKQKNKREDSLFVYVWCLCCPGRVRITASWNRRDVTHEPSTQPACSKERRRSA